ncbi:GNAT family N-acetyltransferase [Roseibium sp.]|uniref:GNAT family N-acetyltransferase n=1 Tax=Roseibium sp. TaxID=1936156 RepID=UPI003BABA15E
MTPEIEFRCTETRDLEPLRQLYVDAFPDEDLFPLVSSLLGGTAPVTSLVAVSGGALAGHVIFTRCTVEPGDFGVALLGPLCVTPELQQSGIGSALVRSGFDHLKTAVGCVFVLGDPKYYARFGFKPDHLVETPCPIPSEWKDAWQSVRLDDGSTVITGRLIVPDAWNDPSLWSD